MKNKRNAGTVLGVLSLLPVGASIVVFNALRGPNADLELMVTIYSLLALLGMGFTISSFVLSRRILLLLFGLLGNGFILGCTYLLLLAIGISEP